MENTIAPMASAEPRIARDAAHTYCLPKKKFMTTNKPRKQTTQETKICEKCLCLSKRQQFCDCSGKMHPKTTETGIELLTKLAEKKARNSGSHIALGHKPKQRRFVNLNGEHENAMAIIKR